MIIIVSLMSSEIVLADLCHIGGGKLGTCSEGTFISGDEHSPAACVINEYAESSFFRGPCPLSRTN